MRMLARFRRWTRFTLRGLLGVLTIICIWAAPNANRAYHQRQAVAAVTKLGGKVTYGFKPLADGEGFLACWLRRVAFYCFCEPVVEVNLTGSDVSDVTDSDLCCLQNLPDLKILNLTGNRRLCGSGLRHIRGCRWIETLQIQITAVDDEAVPHILALRRLRELYLYGAMIGDRGVGQLKELPNLEKLELCRTNITDGAPKSIRQFPGLVELHVAGTSVTDAGLRELEDMRSLRNLHLAGFEFRRGKPGWATCRVTPEGVARFERKAPWCRVWYEGGHDD